jgi:hypothetical protein
LRDLHRDDFSRLNPVVALLDERQLEHCFSSAIAASHPSGRSQALAELAPYLSSKQLQKSLIELPRFGDKFFVAVAKAALLIHLSPDASRSTLEPMLDILKGAGQTAFAKMLRVSFPPRVWSHLIGNLEAIFDEDGAGELPAEDRELLFTKALVMQDAERREQIFASLAPYLRGDAAIKAFEALTGDVSSGNRQRTMARGVSFLLPHLPEPMQRSGIEFALSAIGNAYEPRDIQIACNVARIIERDRREQLLMHARGLARNDKYRGAAIVLAPLFDFVSPEEREKLLQETMGETYAGSTMSNVVALYPFLNAGERARILSHSIEILQLKGGEATLSMLENVGRLPFEFDLAILERLSVLMLHSRRPSVMLAVARLAETIAKVEGIEGIQTALRAVSAVAEQFP